jgi:hypothetical protein
MIDAEGFPGITLIMGGTLDDTSRLKPTTSYSVTRLSPGSLGRDLPRYQELRPHADLTDDLASERHAELAELWL